MTGGRYLKSTSAPCGQRFQKYNNDQEGGSHNFAQHPRMLSVAEIPFLEAKDLATSLTTKTEGHHSEPSKEQTKRIFPPA